MNKGSIVRVVIAATVVVVGVIAIRAFLARSEQATQRSKAIIAARAALEGERDAEAALRVTVDALKAFPDEPELLLIRGAAYVARHRLSDAVRALEDARLRAPPAGDLTDEIEFHLARARMLRFVDAGDPGDYNQAEGPLESARQGSRFRAAAATLLGLGLARRGTDVDRARTLLQEGLQGSLTPGVEWDVQRARDALQKLPGT